MPQTLVNTVYFGRLLVSVVTVLSTLRLGETSKAEALRRIPVLQPCKTRPYATPRYDADECFSGVVTNGLPGRLLWRTENDVLSHGLRWWGFRGESLSVVVKFTSGRVSYFGYGLWVSAPGVMPASVPPPPQDGKLGVVVRVSVSWSNSHLEESHISATACGCRHRVLCLHQFLPHHRMGNLGSW